MPKIDIPIKRLFQRRPADWVKYIQPECREDWIRPHKSEGFRELVDGDLRQKVQKFLFTRLFRREVSRA